MGIRFTNPWWVVVGAVTGLFVCNGPVLDPYAYPVRRLVGPDLAAEAAAS